MTQEDWHKLSELLLEVADLPYATYADKLEEVSRQLTPEAYAALEEISAWLAE